MKMIYIILVTIFIFIVATPMIFAQQEPTQQFNKIFLDPFYRQSMDKNTDYIYTLEVNPPDRVSSVESAIITFQLWLNPTVEFFLTVNGQTCNTPSYEVHTTYANAGEGTIFFDCSNVIQEAGTYDIVLTPDDDTGAITGWIDLTYTNEPKGDADVYGTEYRATENGTVFLQLFDSSGSTINNASCEVTIYNPNKTIWYDGIDMDFLNNGLYYKDLFIPNMPGIYMVSAFCRYDDIGSVIHTEENVIYDGTLEGVSDDYAQVMFSDCAWVFTKGSYQEFNMTDPEIGNINVSLVSKIDVNLIGTWEANFVLQLYNYNTLTWDNISNTYSKTNDKNKCWGNQGITGTVTSNYADYINGDEILIRWQGDESNKEIRTDEISLHFHTTGNYIADIRGSGELHVNDWFNNYTGMMAKEIWDWHNKTLTEFNFDVVNETEITENVWNYNGTISNNILSQFASIIWSFANRTLTSFGSLINNIWNYEPRNVTVTNDLTNYSHIEQLINESNTDNINYTIISELIENRTVNDLTNYTQIQEMINDRADITNYTLIADLIGQINITDLTNYTLIEGLISDRNDITNYTEVWNLIENRTVNDLTNYTLMSEIVENRNQSDLTNYTLISELIGSINVTDLTNYSLITDIIANRTDITDYNEIWNLIENRTLTDLTDYDLIQTLTWNATVRELTGFNITVNANLTSNDIANAVWNYNGTINSGIITQFIDRIECLFDNFRNQENGWGVDLTEC